MERYRENPLVERALDLLLASNESIVAKIKEDLRSGQRTAKFVHQSHLDRLVPNRVTDLFTFGLGPCMAVIIDRQVLAHSVFALDTLELEIAKQNTKNPLERLMYKKIFQLFSALSYDVEGQRMEILPGMDHTDKSLELVRNFFPRLFSNVSDFYVHPPGYYSVWLGNSLENPGRNCYIAYENSGGNLILSS